MVRAPRITGKELIKILRAFEFEVVRVRGSHHLLEAPDGRKTVVPVHAREVIGPGLLSKICRDIGLEPKDLLE